MSTSSRNFLLILVVGFAAMTLLRLPYLRSGFLSNDEGGYAAGAQVMMSGGALYKDAFDHKPPGFFLLYLAARALEGGDGLFTLRCFYVLLVGAQGILLALLLRTWLLPEAAAMAGAFAMLLTSTGRMEEMQACHPEIALLVPGLLAMLAAKMASPTIGPLLSGLCLGLSFQMKQSALFWALPVAWLLWTTHRGDRRRSIVAMVLFGNAIIDANLLFFVPAILMSGWEDFAAGFFHYNAFYYRAMNLGTMLDVQRESIGQVAAPAALIWLLGFIGLVLVFQSARTWPGPNSAFRQWNVFLALWLIASVLAVIVAKKGFHHYFIQIMPLAAALAGVSLDRMQRSAKGSPRAAILVWMIVLAYLFATNPIYFNPKAVARVFRGEPLRFALQTMSDPIAEEVRLLVKPSERLLVWGFFPQLYPLSDRLPAARFTFCQPLTGVDLTYPGIPLSPEAAGFVQELREKLLADIDAHPPKLIIDTAPSGLWGWAGGEFGDIPGFAEILNRDFQPSFEQFGFKWYVRKPGS